MSAPTFTRKRVEAVIKTAEDDLKLWMGVGASGNDFIVEEFGGHDFRLTVDDLRVLIAAAKRGAV